MNISIKNRIFAISIAVMLVLGFFAVMPANAQAGNGEWYDPFCIWSGCDDEPSTVNYTNSNNTNSNVNSPGGTVVADNHNSNVGTPVYSYDTPTYDYDNYSQLKASCYPMPPQAETGDTVVWASSIYGGTGSYYVTWTGTDSLSGSGDSVSKRYYNDGIKSASIRVVSGNQTITKNCDATTRIYDDGDYDYDNDYDYDDDYGNLRVSCSPNRTNGYDGTTITWTAYPSGGNGSYSYDWDGSESLRGSGRSVYKTYNNDGDKYARVTVRSAGRSVTERCDDEVSIDDRYNDNRYTPVYVAPISTNTLDIGCFADPASIRVGQPSTWSAEVVGGYGPYTYSWSGTDGLNGNQSSQVKYYNSTGEKSAVVTVTSADGKSGSRSCTNTVSVRSATTPAPTTNVDNGTDDDSGLSASALFSLKNVPWGWVALLIILVLFSTVMYLLFNRTKI